MNGTDLASPGLRFHHIGYAVPSIEAYLRDYMRPLFRPVAVSDITADPVQQVSVCFATLQGGTVIELVEPLGANSPVRQIIGSQRGGLYHLCFEADDFDGELKRFRARRCMPLGRPTAAPAFGGRRIVFLLTPQRDLLELLDGQP
jgi:methylmalonyl-CoA/ethylmalonyl-CoA epimerase